MASRKMPRRNTPWRPVTWDREYRGLSIWVEEMYSSAPKWSWSTQCGLEGRSSTRLTAMRDVMKAIDATHTKGNGT